MLESQVFYEDYTWYVKLKDNRYNDTKYVEIDVDLSSIESMDDIESLFEIISENLPEGYQIADWENLYTVNDLPCEYWHKTHNPPCFESESWSESDSEPEYDWNRPRRTQNYFDSLIKDF